MDQKLGSKRRSLHGQIWILSQHLKDYGMIEQICEKRF